MHSRCAPSAACRVSTNQQDVDNQRHGILEYANKNSLGHLEFISDSVSGQKRWRDRELGQLLVQTATAGDLIVFAEISRMARPFYSPGSRNSRMLYGARTNSSHRQTTDGSR